MNNIITNSAAAKFNECHQLYNLSMEMNIHPVKREENDGMSVGSALHAALAFNTPIKVHDDKTAKLAGVLQAYEAHYGADGGYPLALIEQGFKILMHKNEGWALCGVADKVCADRVVDHKFYAQQNQYLHDRFAVNSQRVYLSAFDKDVFEYDIVIKPSIRLKKNQSLAEYQIECCEKMLGDRSKHFTRVELYFDAQQIDEMFQWYSLIIDAIERNRETKIWRKNYSACVGQYSRCAYYAYCHHYNGKHDLALQNGYVIDEARTHEELKRAKVI
ncbi:hypothetical protein [Sulfuricurvum sp.]|uniref:hypothetical protein n=1 Tax=Sulfuricurvum sp. TaxID=2025608 RepID=UPI003566EEB2